MAQLHRMTSLHMLADDVSVVDDHDPFPSSSRAPMEKSYRRTKMILFALISVAVGLVLTTYFLLKSREEVEFETSFKIFARETAVLANKHAENVFGQLQSLASAVRSSVPESSSAHQVIIPDFDLRAEEIANLTGIELLMFVPFVPKEEQQQWQDFQIEHQQWIVEGYHYRGWDASRLKSIPTQIHNYTLPEGYNDTRRGFVDDGTGFMEQILSNHTQVNTTTGYSVPIAQIGPRLNDTSIVMTDLFTHPIVKKEIIASLEYDVPVISEPEPLHFLLDKILHHQPIDYSMPRSFTLDPVKAGFQKESLTIGYIVGVISWTSFFGNFLPEDINGIVVNVESDCGKSFTYAVNGGKPDEWYLDDNNHPYNNQQYQHLQERLKFFWKEHPKGTSRHCHFDLVITPSQQFADSYQTNGPLIWAAIVLAVILLVALAFFVYDSYNRKQQLEMQIQKEQAEAVVTSLFPKQVGQQLMAEQGRQSDAHHQLVQAEEEQRGTGPVGMSSLDSLGFASLNLGSIHVPRLSNVPGLSNIQDYVPGLGNIQDYVPGLGGIHIPGLSNPATDQEEEPERAVPLAELYPSASIMFADLKGFTAWSSDRQPSDVFKLLETIYHEMDELAKKYKVFKIETIGDCYVAVCGLPRKRDNHAVFLAWFAQRCLTKFNKMVLQLEEELPGTAQLELRTGLHSGPVTAGVLRGERARFQLFGDTVNTTARIETTGQGSRIHLSQQFAQELSRHDKGHWAVPREDKVEAKGKGILSTFWLEISADNEKRPNLSGHDGSITDLLSIAEDTSSSDDSTTVQDDGDEFAAESSVDDCAAGDRIEAFQLSQASTNNRVGGVEKLVDHTPLRADLHCSQGLFGDEYSL